MRKYNIIFLFEDGKQIWLGYKVSAYKVSKESDIECVCYAVCKIAPEADGTFKTHEIERFDSFHNFKNYILEINKKISTYAAGKEMDEKILIEKIHTVNC